MNRTISRKLLLPVVAMAMSSFCADATPRLAVFDQHLVAMSRQRHVSLEEAVKEVRSWGIEGVDLMFNRGVGEATRQRLLSGGLKPSSVIVFMDLAHTNNVSLAESAIAYAVRVGSPQIMLVPGFCGKGEDRAAAWSAMKPNLADFVRRAAVAKVDVGLEDFDSRDAVVGSCAHLAEAFAACPELGHVLDTGNYLFWKEDVCAAQKAFAGRIRHVHVKDVVVGDDGVLRSVTAGTGVIPLGDVVRSLRTAGYPGWLAIECFGSPDMWDTVQTGARHLRSLWQE